MPVPKQDTWTNGQRSIDRVVRLSPESAQKMKGTSILVECLYTG
jgi:hypothetical protein